LETPYDWISIAIFAGLVVLFMQRSTLRSPRDSLWQYLAASIGCALANWFGNNAEGRYLYHIAAIAVILGTLAYIWFALRPLDRRED
jgi:asparagine N-glycosylation enzyme membrane subunit Stt3